MIELLLVYVMVTWKYVYMCSYKYSDRVIVIRVVV